MGRGRKERIRIPGIASVYRPLLGTVRIHRHELPQKDMADAGVVPAVVEHLPARQNHRMEVMILIEAELPYFRSVGVHEVQVADLLAAVPAGNRLIRSGRAEHNLAVRQIAAVHGVDIVGHLRDLPEARSVDIQFPEFPVDAVGPGEEEAVAVEMEIEFADVLPFIGAIDRLELSLQERPATAGKSHCRIHCVPATRCIRGSTACRFPRPTSR